jgi:hypothetical protein
VNLRFLVLGSALLICAGGALAEGTYQRAKDGKTLVWNSDPKAGDIATWQGARDADGYATGFGTLTWFTGRSMATTNKPAFYGRYFGRMVRGKWDGQVNAHSRGKTAHATFADGNRTGNWAAGPASAWKVAEKSTEPADRPASVEAAPPTPPAQGPSPAPDQPKTEIARHNDVVKAEPAPKKAIAVPSPEPPKPDVSNRADDKKTGSKVDNSLQALFAPPSRLRPDSLAEAPPAQSPSSSTAAASEAPAAEAAASAHPAELTEPEVIDLADTEALGQGYELGKYLPPKVDYSASKNRWSVFYGPKSGDNAEENTKPLIVAVEDKTKKTSVIMGKR